MVAMQRQMIQALVEAGCKYVHIDEPGYTAYVDEPSLEAMRKRGEDPMANFSRSLKAESKVVENLGEHWRCRQRGTPNCGDQLPACLKTGGSV